MSLGVNSNAPARSGVAITPSNSTIYDPPLRAIYVGVTGNLVVTLADDSAAVTITAAAVGYHPLNCSKVMAATAATSLIGLR